MRLPQHSPPPAQRQPIDSSPAGSGTTTSSETENTTTKDSKSSTGVIAVGNKQFITVETRDGKIFYLIIDGDRDADNVYLVTEVSTQDLQSFTTEEGKTDNAVSSGSGNTSSDTGGGTPSSDADTDILIDGGKLPSKDTPQADDVIPIGDENSSANSEETPSNKQSSDPEKESGEKNTKGNPILGWIVIALIALVAVFAGYMFLIVLPRRKAKEAYLDNEEDEDYLEESYEENPEVQSEKDREMEHQESADNIPFIQEDEE